jgi:hypothetical protein
VATRDAGLGSTHAAIRDHADRYGRTHGRGDDTPGDHPKVDRRPEGRDRREREGRDAQAQGGLEETRSAQGCDHPEAHHGAQGHHAEVAEARRRREEGRERAQAQGGLEETHGAQGHHAKAAHGPQGRHAEVAEARRRREEGRERAQAQDGRGKEGLDLARTQDGGEEERGAQGCDQPEAHHGAQGHHAKAAHGPQGRHAEVAEARRRREEGRERAQAQDGRGQEDLEHTDAPDGTEDGVPPSSVASRA